MHDQAASGATTDWPQIVALYDVLDIIAPSPLVTLNRAVAVGMSDGPAAGLTLIEDLAAGGQLAQYHLLHASRAHFLHRLGRSAEALAAYRTALGLAGNDVERAFLATASAHSSTAAPAPDRCVASDDLSHPCQMLGAREQRSRRVRRG